MMSKRSKTFVAGLHLSAWSTFARADGRIIQIDLSGPDDPVHPDAVQLTIQGGFNVAGCDAVSGERS